MKNLLNISSLNQKDFNDIIDYAESLSNKMKIFLLTETLV